MNLLSIHANVFAWPTKIESGPLLQLRGKRLETFQNVGGGPPLFLECLEARFDTVQQQLTEQLNADCEPDGFVLISGHEDGRFWRLNAHLYEHHDRLHRIELHGEVPAHAFNVFLTSLGWPSTRLAFELVQEGVTLDETAFRAYANATD